MVSTFIAIITFKNHIAYVIEISNILTLVSLQHDFVGSSFWFQLGVLAMQKCLLKIVS